MNEGKRIYSFCNKIFPIYRHLTGEGVRETLSMIKKEIRCGDELFKICEIPSGTKVYDWKVPKEWSIAEGYIEDSNGNVIVNISDNNLCVVGYSTPINAWIELKELLNHIYTQPDQPDVIPYVTSYYEERWGFCMSEIQKNAMKEGYYHVVIDSKLFDGNLSYGELIIPGSTKDEVFFSTYVCHPSMANNECSGPALAIELAKYVLKLSDRRFSYRFIFIPETIGSITYLAIDQHLDYMKTHMKCGFNLTCVGDDRCYSMVHSRYGNNYADKVLENILRVSYRESFKEYSFLERGSDERQYCAPGVDLPVVGFSRSLFHKYPEYHTSADNMGLVSPSGFQGSFEVMKEVIDIVEKNYKYRNKILCEPQLGKRGLYPTFSQKHSSDVVQNMSNFLAYSDGTNDLIDISNITGIPVKELIHIADILNENGEIIEKCQ